MKFSDLKSSILEQFKTTNEVVPFIVGKPGGGKSSCAREIAQELAVAHKIPDERIIEFNPSLREPCDVLGLPQFNGDCTKWLPPEEFWMLRQGLGPCVLILEELSDADMNMQNPLCRVVLDRCAGQLRLSDELFIIATGNRTEDRSGANRLSTKLANRMREIEFTENLDDWLEWAQKNDIPVKLQAFLRFRPNLLSDFNPKRSKNPTPRSWASVALIPESIEKKSSIFMEHVAGSVGDGAAAEYVGFLKIMKRLPDASKIISDPDGGLIPMTDTLKDAVVKAINEKPANADHAKLMADVKTKYEAYLKSGSKTLFDCPEWHALQTYNGGDKVGHIPLIRTYAENVLETLHWMQKHGTPVMDRVSQGAGALWQRTHQVDAPAGTGLIEPLLKAANKEGVKIITGMRAQELIYRNGEVVGVKASDKVGNSYEFKSKYGVILATGGYSQNKEMRQKSSPVLTPDMVSTNQPGATGDGIVMATKIGADLTGMNYVQVYPLATPGSGALQGRARKMSGLDDVIDVNKNGLRFVKEDARRDEFVAAIKKQPGAMCYDINDSSIVQEYNSFAENVETLVKLGRIYKDDTLEGLAKQLGMPPENLKATVEEFNKMVEAKNDPKFGRKLFDRKIEKAPFYATPRAPSIHHTMGGLYINPKAQVLDKKGNVIKGLYAAGEVTGGVHGSNRLGGNATADVLTFGRIAAKTALGLNK